MRIAQPFSVAEKADRRKHNERKRNAGHQVPGTSHCSRRGTDAMLFGHMRCVDRLSIMDGGLLRTDPKVTSSVGLDRGLRRLKMKPRYIRAAGQINADGW